jgi:hypothetical protein
MNWNGMITPQEMLCKAVKIGPLSLAKKALKLGADSKYYYSFALRFAAQNGHTKVVEELKKHYTKTELQELGIE